MFALEDALSRAPSGEGVCKFVRPWFLKKNVGGSDSYESVAWDPDGLPPRPLSKVLASLFCFMHLFDCASAAPSLSSGSYIVDSAHCTLCEEGNAKCVHCCALLASHDRLHLPRHCAQRGVGRGAHLAHVRRETGNGAGGAHRGPNQQGPRNIYEGPSHNCHNHHTKCGHRTVGTLSQNASTQYFEVPLWVCALPNPGIKTWWRRVLAVGGGGVWHAA